MAKGGDFEEWEGGKLTDGWAEEGMLYMRYVNPSPDSLGKQ